MIVKSKKNITMMTIMGMNAMILMGTAKMAQHMGTSKGATMMETQRILTKLKAVLVTTTTMVRKMINSAMKNSFMVMSKMTTTVVTK